MTKVPQYNHKTQKIRKPELPATGYEHLHGEVRIIKPAELAHLGQHKSCRECKTNPRSLGTNPRASHNSLPHPLKCSECDYIATSVNDSKNHRLDEH